MTEILAVQKALGAPATGKWDAATASRARTVQGAHGLMQTGLPDAPLFIALGLEDPKKQATGVTGEYIASGEAPGTFVRDLGASMNQIPRLAWGVTAAAFFGLAYWSYRRGAPERSTRRRSSRRTTRRRSYGRSRR
jgi:hypothetical protein